MTEKQEKEEGSSADYEVGYGRPPVHTRFRKGQSGNPRGPRARGKTMPEAIRTALRAKVIVTENGQRKSMPYIEVIARQLAKKAAGGDLSAIRTIALLCPEIQQELPRTIQVVVSATDMRL
jgi:hypothetical protein